MNFPYLGTECSCDIKEDLKISQLEKSNLIFRGEVTEKRTENFEGLGYRRIAVFKVNEIIHGVLIDSTVEIGYDFRGPCTVDFHPRNEYLILADTIHSFSWFSTEYCSGNRRIRDMSRNDVALLSHFQRNVNYKFNQ